MELTNEKRHAIFLEVMNGDIKSCKSSSSLLCFDLVCVHMSKCCFINVNSKHNERLIFDRLSVRDFCRLLNFTKS